MMAAAQDDGVLPANGQHLAQEIELYLRKHVVFSHNDHPTVVTLWCMLTHSHDAFWTSPILALTSPGPGSGKSTVLQSLRRICPKGHLVSDLTPASLYRFAEKLRPTLLIDEVDEVLKAHPGLVGILNGAHARNNSVLRSDKTDSGNFEANAYSAWCPKAMAGIGVLPKALESRTIALRMFPKGHDDKTTPLSLDINEEELRLNRELEKWAIQNIQLLKMAEPSMPGELLNRNQDNWKPLCAIADCLGGDYPQKVRDIAVRYVAGQRSRGNDPYQFLADCRDAFRCNNDEGRISSQGLCDFLNELNQRPWAELNMGRGISVYDVSERLEAFDIHPRKLRVKYKEKTRESLRGYRIDDFRQAFERCLGAFSIGAEHPEHIEHHVVRVGSDVPVVPDVLRSPHTDDANRAVRRVGEGGNDAG